MVNSLHPVSPYEYNVGHDVLNGDFNKVELVPHERDDGGIPGPFTGGIAIKPDFLPTKMRWCSKKPMPDFDRGSVINMSERGKDIIEQIEPGVHQFFPVDFQIDNTDKWEKRYFLNTCQRIDSLDREKTTMVFYPVFVEPLKTNIYMWRPAQHLVYEGEQHLIPSHLTPETKPKLVFNLKQIGNRHLWCDKYLNNGPFMSSILKAALKDAKLTGLDHDRPEVEAV